MISGCYTLSVNQMNGMKMRNVQVKTLLTGLSQKHGKTNELYRF